MKKQTFDQGTAQRLAAAHLTQAGSRPSAEAEPDEMSGSLEAIENEALASEFKHKYDAIGKRLTELRPLYVEIRKRFFNLRKGTSIMGSKTWTEFCEKHLKYSDRHVRRLIEGDNPATEKHRGHRVTDPLPKPKQSLPMLPPANNADWTDNEYVKTCVNFVESTLRPLESDPERFHRVATAIAEQIAESDLETVGQ